MRELRGGREYNDTDEASTSLAEFPGPEEKESDASASGRGPDHRKRRRTRRKQNPRERRESRESKRAIESYCIYTYIYIALTMIVRI